MGARCKIRNGTKRCEADVGCAIIVGMVCAVTFNANDIIVVVFFITGTLPLFIVALFKLAKVDWQCHVMTFREIRQECEHNLQGPDALLLVRGIEHAFDDLMSLYAGSGDGLSRTWG